MSKRIVKARQTRVIGDSMYSVAVTIDMAALLRNAGQRAAWAESGRATAFGGAVVVTARQANVARGRK